MGLIDDTTIGQRRDVPVGGDLLLDLENAADGQAHTDWLLRTPDGRGWNITRWRRVWKAAVRKAGLEGLTAYALRDTAASLAMHSGANIMTIQWMLGRTKPAITPNIYSHLWVAELDALPKGMDNHFKR